jgi:biopolymer transport protein ExbB
MIEFLLQGGKTMLPLFICSLVSLTVIIERFLALRRSQTHPAKLVDMIEEGRPLSEIVEKARALPSCLSNIILGLYVKKGHAPEGLHSIFLTLYKKEINTLERGLVTLEVIAAITPLLGLLGTVLGMVDVFNVVAEVGVGQASALSHGIAKALITTIAGLSIAIPTLVFHSFFIKKTETIALAVEETAQTFYQGIK